MRPSVVSFTKLLACFLFSITVHAILEWDKQEIGLFLNDNYEFSLPMLDGLQTQHEFPMTDIESLEIIGGIESAQCVLWSDKDFAWASIGYDDDGLDSALPNANRLFCYDSDEIAPPVMIEDMSGNRELLQLHQTSPGYLTAKLERPMYIRRAISLTDDRYCRFRSKRSFSGEFDAEDLSEPFRGAIAVYCKT